MFVDLYSTFANFCGTFQCTGRLIGGFFIKKIISNVGIWELVITVWLQILLTLIQINKPCKIFRFLKNSNSKFCLTQWLFLDDNSKTKQHRLNKLGMWSFNKNIHTKFCQIYGIVNCSPVCLYILAQNS